MPKAFVSCVKRGGRVRTISRGRKYFRVCYLNGKSYKGETRTKKMKRK